MKLSFVRTAVIIGCQVFAVSTARAISFDKLDDLQSVIAGPGETIKEKSLTTSDAIGTQRYVQVFRASGGRVSTEVVGGLLIHSQDAATPGATYISWDARGTSVLQPNGLGGVDLTKDDATAIKVIIDDFDFPNNQSLKLVFTFYDASDPTGLVRSSTGSIILNTAVQFPTKQTMEIPFTSLTNNTPLPADLKNIGAITLLIDGNNAPASDLAISFIGTNGRCSHVPVNRFIVDQCGVCEGNNSSCSDCEGTPNGASVAGTACSTGNLGICSAGTWSGRFPTCSCSQGQQPVTESCDSLDNNCNGLVDDGLGVGNTCTAGVGACQTSGVLVCSSTGGTACTAQAGSPQTEICDGIDNDCDGATDEENPAMGPNTDVCGICGGNGKSCLDCNGKPFGTAKTDGCGVCGGDGSSCLACNSVNVFDTLAAMDGGAKEQETIIRKATQVLSSMSNGKRFKTYIAQTLARAHHLQVRNWVLSWQVPQIVTSCQVNSFCVTTSNMPQLSEYRQHNTELLNLGSDVLSKIKAKKGTKVFAKWNDLKKWNVRQHKKNEDLSFTVPETNYVCGPVS